MRPFSIVTGPAAWLLEDDVNTDQIAPGSFLRDFQPDYAALLFGMVRYDAGGAENPSFILNKPSLRKARILVTGRNFGAGSSREQAVWAMTAFGIQCIIARSFADMYRENCLKNGLLPVVLGADHGRFEAKVAAANGTAPFSVNLIDQTITCPDNELFTFAIAPGERDALLNGLDDIGLSLQLENQIATWETRMRAEQPWRQTIPHYQGGRIDEPRQ
jgi:3-isopropylmalate dehydratase small subunit